MQPYNDTDADAGSSPDRGLKYFSLKIDKQLHDQAQRAVVTVKGKMQAAYRGHIEAALRAALAGVPAEAIDKLVTSWHSRRQIRRGRRLDD